MAEPPKEPDGLEELAAEFLDRQRRGETPSMEEYAARYPTLADEIRDVFPAMIAMERIKIQGEKTPDGRASLGPVKLERLGDFRIVREIGRGGMGIVYEAEQESLGRRVALKVLPRQALLEERHLARFKRESQIASRLHHTNIVQVYAVGEQEGFHYYVMQYVRGEGLDRVIAHLRQLESAPSGGRHTGMQAEGDSRLLERICAQMLGHPHRTSAGLLLQNHEYYRAAARIAVQAAEALAYAHAQGTLHRDVKPANMLLDDEGVVWLVDFGLATATDAARVTQTGDLTGTLRYLAPERFSGQVDERGDIYSLGLALYELLTLRPAYDEEDQSTMIRRISQEAPARPRKVNPVIPKDLETIVLKAIARVPERRYASAAAMEEDLRRFLEDRPVLARRIGLTERLWRWCRRNRAIALLSTATLLLLFAVAAVAIIGYVRTKGALDSEAIQRQRADVVAKLARDAVDRVFERLAPVPSISTASITIGDSNGTSVEIPRQVVPSKETVALLEEMLPFYDRLAGQTGDDQAVQMRAADATRRIGDIRQRLGQYDQATAAYREACEKYRELASRQGDDSNLLLSTAETCNELGKTLRLSGKMDEAKDAHRQALELLEAAAPKAASQTAVRLELARTYYLLVVHAPANPGMTPPGPGEGQASMGSLSRDGERPMPPPQPGDRSLQPGLHGEPAGGGSGTEIDREARRLNLDRATALLKGLVQDQPTNPDYRHLLALCYREMSPHGGQAGQTGYDNAVEILSGLVKDFPQESECRFDLCETYAATDAHDPMMNLQDLLLVETRLRKALEISQELLQQQPNVPEYLVSQSYVYHKLGEATRRMRRLDEAERNDRKAAEIQAALAEEFPEVTTYKVWLAAFRNSLADTLNIRGNLREARVLLETNISHTEQLLQANPAMWYLHAVLMEANRSLANVLRQSKEDDLADAATRSAEEHRRELHSATQ